jgi:hypothetical protein
METEWGMKEGKESGRARNDDADKEPLVGAVERRGSGGRVGGHIGDRQPVSIISPAVEAQAVGRDRLLIELALALAARLGESLARHISDYRSAPPLH